MTCELHQVDVPSARESIETRTLSLNHIYHRLELSSQLVLMWDRFGPDNEIDCVEDLTRLTFDTIGLCAFNFRFNEFYTDEPHPFARQLGEVLMESGKRAHRPEILNRLLFFRDEQRRQENIVEIHTLCDKIIQDRLDNPMPDATDLLNVLLHGIDKETGEKLPLENVKYQIGTFLAAGYETTASTLSFFYYHLCDNPDKLDRLQAEVDQVLGDKVITVDMLPKLVYLDACIKETLRLNPPANIFTRCAIQDTLLAGKYLIKKDVPVSCLLRCLHRDPKIWGNDAEAFRPERLMGGAFEALPKGAWQPVCCPQTLGCQSNMDLLLIQTHLLVRRWLASMHWQILFFSGNVRHHCPSTTTISHTKGRSKL